MVKTRSKSVFMDGYTIPLMPSADIASRGGADGEVVYNSTDDRFETYDSAAGKWNSGDVLYTSGSLSDAGIVVGNDAGHYHAAYSYKDKALSVRDFNTGKWSSTVFDTAGLSRPFLVCRLDPNITFPLPNAGTYQVPVQQVIDTNFTPSFATGIILPESGTYLIGAMVEPPYITSGANTGKSAICDIDIFVSGKFTKVFTLAKDNFRHEEIVSTHMGLMSNVLAGDELVLRITVDSQNIPAVLDSTRAVELWLRHLAG